MNKKISSSARAELIEGRKNGVHVDELAKMFNVSRSTVYRYTSGLDGVPAKHSGIAVYLNGEEYQLVKMLRRGDETINQVLARVMTDATKGFFARMFT